MKSYCAKCKNETNQKILFSKDIHFAEESGWWDDTSYQVIECMGCETVSFRMLYDDVSRNGDEENNTISQELFPTRGQSNLEKKFVRNIPREIKAVYNEVIDSYNDNLVLLCSIGVRGGYSAEYLK